MGKTDLLGETKSFAVCCIWGVCEISKWRDKTGCGEVGIGGRNLGVIVLLFNNNNF